MRRLGRVMGFFGGRGLPLAGALMTLGFAPFNLWPLSVLALVFLLRAVDAEARPGAAARRAFGWGMGHGVTALYWLPWSFFKDSGGSWAFALLGGVPAAVGLAAFSALTYVLAAYAAARLAHGAARVGIFGVLVVLIEILRGLTPYGFPWLPVGAVLANWPVLAQAASVGGVYVLTALMLLVAGLARQLNVRGLVAAAVVLVLMAGLGQVRMMQVLPPQPVAMVRLVQPNLESGGKWDLATRWNYMKATLGLALGGQELGPVPPTVVLPETAIVFFLEQDSDVREGLAARLPVSTTLVTGVPRRADEGLVPRFYNSMVTLEGDGTLSSGFDKKLLVPFGEFIPLRGVLEALPLPIALRTFSSSRMDYTHGTRPPYLTTPAGRAVGLICYEGIFPLHVARYAKEARYLINITNDGWFTGTSALGQHVALERLRTIETGRPLVRVANTGISAVYDAYGREIARLPVAAPATLDAPLPAALPGGTMFMQLVSLL